MSDDGDRLMDAALDEWRQTYQTGKWDPRDKNAFIMGFIKGATYQLKTPLTRVQMMLDEGSDHA